MKIGILTLPLHTNYGGILQAYALQTILERMGNDVCLIEKEWKPVRLSLWKAPLVYGKRIVRNMTGHPFPIFYEQKINRERPAVQQYTDKFISKYIKRRIINEFSDIKETDFDAIVVGSDQVWRPPMYFYGITHAYLDFAEGWNIKRVAYAASFGKDEWEYTPMQTQRCGELLRQFDAVSVREDLGVTLCREHFGVAAQHVLDPTMLLQKEDYIRLFETANTLQSGGTLMSYILDESQEKSAIIGRMAKEYGLKVFKANSRVENHSAPLADRIQPPVEQWLRGFHDAEFVVTDSFHACVFSIIFQKPFIVVGNAKRGLSRLSSLLAMFGLESRLVTNGTAAPLDGIDFAKVNVRLEELRRNSAEFLERNIINNINK